MKTSALKTMAAVAMMTSACVSFAQQSADPSAPATTGEPAGSVSEDTTTMDRSTYARGSDMNRSCIGLADRQTEAACRQGYPSDHADAPLAASQDLGGRTEDQAN